MSERTIDWGGANSPYESSVDKNDNGRVILAEDTSGGTVLLEYDESANSGSGGWIYRGPVEMSGNDVTGVGQLDAASISTEEGQVTDETLIEAELSTTTGSTTAGTYVNIIDQINQDNRSEMANDQFAPDKTGRYIITGNLDITGVSGDNARIRVRDVGDDSTPLNPITDQEITSGSREIMQYRFAGKLTSGSIYQIEATNSNSDFEVQRFLTDCEIRWDVIQP